LILINDIINVLVTVTYSLLW